MKLDFISEPLLEFGEGQHIDIRFGLMNFKPFDFQDARSPKEIKLGIVGTTETIEGLNSWLQKIEKGVSAKESNQPNLFTQFPGFGSNTNLPTPLVTSAAFHRRILSSHLEKVKNFKHINEIVLYAVNIFMEEIEYLSQKVPTDIIMVAVPDELLDIMDKATDEDTNKGNALRLDFHDLLKARAMHLNIHTQLILPSTYDESKLRKQKRRHERKQKPQDEATRAWNLYNALYYKKKGIPWRLVRDNSQFTTCFVGISFYKNLDGTELQTSIAQVFNELGNGVIVRGGTVQISKEDRQPHLSQDDAESLLNNALDTYKREHRTLPARVVLHKTSSFNIDELNGFRTALGKREIELYDFLTIRQSYTRLFRVGAYPPLRGTMLSLDDKHHIVYTRGSVDFFETYPGMYVPAPLEFICDSIQQTPRQLAEEILGLTKMNWNKTQFDGTTPITIWAARKVGEILRHVKDGETVQPRYSFYM